MKTINLSYPLSVGITQEYAEPQVVAIGQFDGVHQGHASVISSAVRLAKQQGLPCAVMTFHPHPKDVMKKGNYEGNLTPLKEKQEMMARLGVDLLYIVEFSEVFSELSPQTFVDGMLLALKVKTAIVGFDFRFGYKGAGHAETLRELGGGSMDVEVIPPFEQGGEKVSSSAIRKALQSGEVEEANRLLGRPYRLRGVVVDGDKRGRTIGFPTANLRLIDKYVVPAKGVYAVRTLVQGQWLSGVMNLGVKPTFQEGVTLPSFEVHLLDFDRDIYGEELTVDLVSYIRSERKFPSIQELVAQIQADAGKAREILYSSQ
ncbi:bifunctional riboflavin kinase/FAD synthetase [Paenibacillus azoreducens]|uniref:Riboflavin biosynthesis protein n=1 Tax=Paenibacillus azoreducens TaxID=116718 RepID=A0A919YEU5_9BACL|nr:bifunctional riboflavin kinase/FAD synthetase [Paenibacillus azoreducens]GIO50376.1 riboflavin biosynthesis protein RibC [Paenibacillus azoreducens]